MERVTNAKLCFWLALKAQWENKKGMISRPLFKAHKSKQKMIGVTKVYNTYSVEYYVFFLDLFKLFSRKRVIKQC